MGSLDSKVKSGSIFSFVKPLGEALTEYSEKIRPFSKSYPLLEVEERVLNDQVRNYTPPSLTLSPIGDMPSREEIEKIKLLHGKERAEYDNAFKLSQEDILKKKQRLDDIQKLRQAHSNKVGGLAAMGLIGAGAGLTHFGANAYRDYKATRALSELSPELSNMIGDIGRLADVGVEPRHIKELVETQLRSTENTLKDLEIEKSILEKERLNRELQKSDTLIGKMQRSTVGQLLGPLAGGAALAGGGLAAMKVIDTFKNIGVPDPTIEIPIRYNLSKIFEIKPMLAGLDRQMILDYYRMIFRIAPSVGRDIRVSANFIENMVNFGGATPVIMKELAEAQQKISGNSMSLPFDVANTGTQLFSMVR